MPGSLAHTPADVLAQWLSDNGHGTIESLGTTGPSDWPIVVGKLTADPDDAIAVSDQQGRDEGRDMVTGEVLGQHGIQILLRAMKQNEGQVKINSIFVAVSALLRSSVTIGASTYLIQCVDPVGFPIPLGTEPGTRRDLFSLNATMSVRQTS